MGSTHKLMEYSASISVGFVWKQNDKNFVLLAEKQNIRHLLIYHATQKQKFGPQMLKLNRTLLI